MLGAVGIGDWLYVTQKFKAEFAEAEFLDPAYTRAFFSDRCPFDAATFDFTGYDDQSQRPAQGWFCVGRFGESSIAEIPYVRMLDPALRQDEPAK